MRLHVFKPKDWKTGDKRSALIFFFGGAWIRGTPEKSAGWARFAAKQGMVGIAPDYRTKERFGTSPLESVADARAALRWVQDHAAELGIDPNHIVVGGNSAGGHLALWTGISQAPPGSNPAESPKTKPAALILISAVGDTTVGPRKENFGANLRALSPYYQLDSKMPPILMFHGDADTVVPYTSAVNLSQKLIQQGNQCQFVTVPGGQHNFSTELPEWKEKVQTIIIAFLAKLQLLTDKKGGDK
jgi:acetyl esterase